MTSSSIIRTRSQERLEQAAEDAAILAAAQEQVATEEEIQGRLPREVLSIQGRLDLQQSSVDLLQDNIDKLTAMVAQLGNSNGHPQEQRPPPQAMAATTPPHYHPNLSPIPEGVTPSSSATPPLARPL